MRDEFREHVVTLLMYLEERARDHKTTAELWEANPEKYGTTIESAAEWAAQGAGILWAHNLLKSRLGV